MKRATKSPSAIEFDILSCDRYLETSDNVGRSSECLRSEECLIRVCVIAQRCMAHVHALISFHMCSPNNAIVEGRFQVTADYAKQRTVN